MSKASGESGCTVEGTDNENDDADLATPTALPKHSDTCDNEREIQHDLSRVVTSASCGRLGQELGRRSDKQQRNARDARNEEVNRRYFSGERQSIAGLWLRIHTPNETELSHRWRGRA